MAERKMNINLDETELKGSEAKCSRFLFSVIMPVYNVEKYVAEAIESLIRQSAGFEENIQLIIVNDGSTDASAEVCREYVLRFPENIVYAEQENAGVSVARNAGLRLAEGCFINFMDSDDKWSENAFAAAAAFFDEHPDINIIAAKKIYFDALNSQHALNFEYAENAVIDLRFQPDHIQSAVHNIWFKKDILDGMEFDPQMKIGEDTLFTCRILLKELRFGVLKDPVYWYRKRQEESSVMDSRKNDPFFYVPILECFHEKIFEISRQLYGRSILFAQYCVMYDLQWRLKWTHELPLSPEESKKYSEKIAALFGEIDDEVILSQRSLSYDHKFSALAMKRGVSESDLRKNLLVIGDYIYLADPSTGSMLLFCSLRTEGWVDLGYTPQGCLHNAGLIVDEHILESVPQDGSCKVSVIIPVYNTENYLIQCVESVMGQTLKDIEIICVDDGSTDSSPEILRSLKERDRRIRIFTKENGGQSSARNLGLKEARGEYILFLDSDDHILPDALRILYGYAKYDDIDELFYGASVDFESEELKASGNTYASYSRNWFYPDVQNGRDLFVELWNRADLKVSPCLQLFRRSFLQENGIKFYEGIIREDELFTLQTLALAERTRVLDIELYVRLVREGSTMTQTRNFSHSYGLFICVKEMLKFIEKHRLWEYPEYYAALTECLFIRDKLAASEVTYMDDEEFWENVHAMSDEDQALYIEYVYPWRQYRKAAEKRIRRVKIKERKTLKKSLSENRQKYVTFKKLEKKYKTVKNSNIKLKARSRKLKAKNKKLKKELKIIQSSSIWKTGRALTRPLRLIKKILKRS